MSEKLSIGNLYADVILHKGAKENAINAYNEVHAKFLTELTELLKGINNRTGLQALLDKYREDDDAVQKINVKLLALTMVDMTNRTL
jgi:hypothetical protein